MGARPRVGVEKSRQRMAFSSGSQESGEKGQGKDEMTDFVPPDNRIDEDDRTGTSSDDEEGSLRAASRSGREKFVSERAGIAQEEGQYWAPVLVGLW